MQAQFQVMEGIKGPITASSLLAAMNGAHNVSFQGILPTWTPSNHITIPGIGSTNYSEANYYFVKVVDGSQEVVSRRLRSTGCS